MEQTISAPNEKKPVQLPQEGEGPLYHRLYRVDFSAERAHAEHAWKKLDADINAFSPQWLASFKKTKGEPGALRKGDEFQVSLSAPWEAPVRVSEVSERSFTLQTLEGHLEAGSIAFRLIEQGAGRYRFEIESVARSKDKIVDFLYDKIPVCRAAQGEMWDRFCRAFAGCAITGEPGDCPEADLKVEIITERRDEETGKWQSI